MSDNPADSPQREPEVVAATLAEQLDREAKEFADSELPNSQYARWLMARVTALEAALEAARADGQQQVLDALEREADRVTEGVGTPPNIERRRLLMGTHSWLVQIDKLGSAARDAISAARADERERAQRDAFSDAQACCVVLASQYMKLGDDGEVVTTTEARAVLEAAKRVSRLADRGGV